MFGGHIQCCSTYLSSSFPTFEGFLFFFLDSAHLRGSQLMVWLHYFFGDDLPLLFFNIDMIVSWNRLIHDNLFHYDLGANRRYPPSKLYAFLFLLHYLACTDIL